MTSCCMVVGEGPDVDPGDAAWMAEDCGAHGAAAMLREESWLRAWGGGVDPLCWLKRDGEVVWPSASIILDRHGLPGGVCSERFLRGEEKCGALTTVAFLLRPWCAKAS